MAKKRTRRSTLQDRIDETILKDMVDVDTLQALLQSFGQICGTGAGIFTPAGVRIGEPAHHHPFCSLLYTTEEGRDRCAECDKAKMSQIRDGNIIEPYRCHAGLIDFCEPVFCQLGGRQCLIGVFFAGQVLYEDDKPTSGYINELKEVATACKIDPDELLARYMQVRRLSRRRVDVIRAWIKEFTKLIGLLVQKKAVTQQLLLEVIDSADDQSAVVHTIRKHLRPTSVSIFLKRDDVPEAFRDRIFLVATTSKELASRVPIEEDLLRISYGPDEGFTGWIYKTGTVLHIEDVRDESTFPKHPYPPKWKHKVKEIPDWAKTQAFLGIPIRSDEGNTVGVIRAVRLKGDRGFEKDEIALLTGIAPLVGVAAAKAQLHKEHSEKIEALNQAESLLLNLTEPKATLDSITKEMVEQLGETYIKNGPWEAVYVLQHLKSSRQFRFVAYFPENLPDKRKGYPFLDTLGVAGHVLKTGKFYASRNCLDDGVEPTTPWTSVVCGPIFQENEMWGAVSLCSSRKLLQTDVDLASLRITQFAENMSLVCRLSEILDAKNTAAIVASNVLSLNVEAHEVYKSLECCKMTVASLCKKIQGKEKQIAQDLAKEIDESLSWADVCLELGRYVKLCQTTPDAAIEVFRERHLPKAEVSITCDKSEDIWEEVDMVEVAQRALASVENLVKIHEARITTVFQGSCILVGDSNLLYRALRNLLENAIVHASRMKGPQIKYKKGVEISFCVKCTSSGVIGVVIQDNGEGMDPRAFAASKEIYADPTLLRSTSIASGFGTTVVAFAISVHLGSITLESGPRQGTRVSIEIPSQETKGENQ